MRNFVFNDPDDYYCAIYLVNLLQPLLTQYPLLVMIVSLLVITFNHFKPNIRLFLGHLK